MILNLFRARATQHVSILPQTEWEWMALAQHHGVPTRLLDWTDNILIAAYFAVKDEHSGDSAIYAFHEAPVIDISKYHNPLEVDSVGRVYPPHVTPRVTRQAGLFTIHPEPTIPTISEAIERIIVESASRRHIKKMLFRLGVHEATVFPDLDGIARHIEWMSSDTY